MNWVGLQSSGPFAMGALSWWFTVTVLIAFSTPAVAVIPAIQKVLTMLSNLVTTLDAEAAEDEKRMTHFNGWAVKEMETSGLEIDTLKTSIEDVTAVLANLYAKKGELETTVAKLKTDIADTTQQINEATQKRNEEHVNFVKEQTDFDNAIASCAKAVDLLGQFYGDGSPAPAAKRPDWMALISKELGPIRKVAATLGTDGHLQRLSLLQKNGKRSVSVQRALSMVLQPNLNRYQESTSEALSIVDTVKVLGSTFADDKQSAIEEEDRLQGVYDGLMHTKQEMLTELQTDLAGNSQILQQTNQAIAEKEGQKGRWTQQLTDEQNYLATVKGNLKEATENYNARKKDRTEEREAVTKAQEVLAKYNTALVQQQSTAAVVHHLAPCKGCTKAATLLSQKATLLHSTMLEAAVTAMTSIGGLDTIVENLHGLITRIEEEAKSEKEHKEWCEKETGFTTKKRDDHSQIITQLQATLANLQEVVVEKDTGLGVNKEEDSEEEGNWDEREGIRKDEKNEFDADITEHNEAIQALNEAINILAKYYGGKGAASFVQQQGASSLRGSAAPKGAGVVTMISETRHEFEQAKATLEKDEDEAVDQFNLEKSTHAKVQNDFSDEKNTLTSEKQSTESQVSMTEEDVHNNQVEVASASSYLERLGKSCYPLLMRYDERVKLRDEEKKALLDAIDVLKNEA